MLLIICFLIASLSSWNLLFVPDLEPGLISPFEAIASSDAKIEDTEAHQQKKSDLVSSTLVQVIDKQQSSKLKNRITRQINELDDLANQKERKALLPFKLNSKEQDWLSASTKTNRKEWRLTILSAAERMLSQGLVSTVALDQLQEATSLQLSNIGEEDNPQRTLGSKILVNAFQKETNLRVDPTRSKRLIEELITKQGIPTIEVKKGDLIVNKGQKISSQAYDVLDHFGLVKRSPKPIAWLYRFIEALASCAILIIVTRKEKPSLQARHGFLILGLLLITQASKVWFGNNLSPLTIIIAPTLLLSQGFGTYTAFSWIAIANLLWTVPIDEIGYGRVIVAFAAASIVALQGGRMRSRAQLFQMAFLLPFGALLGEWFILRNQVSGTNNNFENLIPNSQDLISEAIVLGTMLMLTILLIPILESAFGLITRAHLMELADQERPLLRRLYSEAPGTFEHTLMICGLAEEGARRIGADVDLIRTGALYHDIGKLYAPKWFIENQTEENNPHEELDDPFKSASILQAHVDEGLKLAKRYRLPAPIADFIPEHQGTLKMGYFLHKAKKINPKVLESEFRYKGPNPRSKETAILMLADGCEAALRSLGPGVSENEAYAKIREIVITRELDGQLKESNLKKAEIELVIRGFISVWKRMRHRRIPYPMTTKKAGYPA